eukprot:857594_1
MNVSDGLVKKYESELRAILKIGKDIDLTKYLEANIKNIQANNVSFQLLSEMVKLFDERYDGMNREEEQKVEISVNDDGYVKDFEEKVYDLFDAIGIPGPEFETWMKTVTKWEAIWVDSVNK